MGTSHRQLPNIDAQDDEDLSAPKPVAVPPRIIIDRASSMVFDARATVGLADDDVVAQSSSVRLKSMNDTQSSSPPASVDPPPASDDDDRATAIGGAIDSDAEPRAERGEEEYLKREELGRVPCVARLGRDIRRVPIKVAVEHRRHGAKVGERDDEEDYARTVAFPRVFHYDPHSNTHLNLRAAPSPDSAFMGRLFPGDEV